MSIKIIEPINNYIREFNTTAEFNLFYIQHKDEIDNTSTHKLNKLYKINGYKLVRLKNELCLKKINVSTRHNLTDVDIKPLQDDIEAFKSDIITIKDAINQIVNALNKGI